MLCKQIRMKTPCVRTPCSVILSYFILFHSIFMIGKLHKNLIYRPCTSKEAVEITPQVFTLCQSRLTVSVSYCHLKSGFTLAYIKRFLILHFYLGQYNGRMPLYSQNIFPPTNCFFLFTPPCSNAVLFLRELRITCGGKCDAFGTLRSHVKSGTFLSSPLTVIVILN